MSLKLGKVPWELDSLLDPNSRFGLAVTLSGQWGQLIDVVSICGLAFAVIEVFGTRDVAALLGGCVVGRDSHLTESSDPGLEGGLGVPVQLDGTVLTRDEHACTAAAAEPTGAPVMLTEGSVNVFGPFAMSVGGVAYVTHDTEGSDLNTGTTGTCGGCLVDPLHSPITSL